MNELAIRPLRADPRNYFVSLVAEGRRLGLVSDGQAERIGMETMALLAKLTLKFTHGASSSVRVETAQRLLASAVYCIGHGLKALGSAEAAADAVCGTSVSALYKQGRLRVEASVAEARLRLAAIQDSMLDTDNLAYNDTLCHGIPAFFADYDAEYGAHESPGSIDYPVCRVPALCGVEYISAYLTRLEMENRFCLRSGYSDALLRGYHRDGKQLLVNLFELSLGSVTGAVLCGKHPAEPLRKEDVAYLVQRLGGLPQKRLYDLLRLAYRRACSGVCLATENVRMHAEAVAEAMLPHIQNALRTGHAEQVFIVPKPASPERIRY
jgi:hypothetical protein